VSPVTLELPTIDAYTPPRVALRDGRARATCPYCGVGCVVEAKVEGGAIVSIHAEADVAPNFGMMCPKGALLARSDAPGRRVTEPMIRDRKGGELRPVSWPEALRRIADTLRHTLEHRGSEAVAWYGSGQLDTEACYLFTKLFKGYLGCNHTDTNSRLCMSSAVAGYRHSFGADGPPTCYDDIDSADTFFVLGANMAANHPVLFNRLRRRQTTDAGCRLIVADPRRTKTAERADLHLPVRPGGDVAMLRLIARRLLDMDRLDHAFIAEHTDGFDALRALLLGLDLPAMHEACGLSAQQIDAAADHMAGRDAPRRLLSFYCMGANQSTAGTDKNTAIIDLQLLLGQVGRAGAGPFSLTGQPNAMGGREVGYLSHQLPGYRLVTVAEDRAQVEAAWGLSPGAIDPAPGRSAVPMFDAAARGRIDVLWIACTNPAVSMPQLEVAQHALRHTPCVIVQDCFLDTETVAYADVLLPAATWGEKTGTMTNSERLVTRSRPARPAPGRARPDWWAPAAVGRAMGFDGFGFATAEQVWDEYRMLTAGTPCDLSGMTNARLEAGGLRWPCPAPDHPGAARRYTDHRFATAHGRARFSAAAYRPPIETPDRDFPLILTTGRVAAHWHTRARTGNVPELVHQAPEPFVEVHPEDAAWFGVADGEAARVVTRHGVTEAKARVTEAVGVGRVFVPMHWGDAFAPRSAANYATHRAYDPVSKQPELKHAAARLEPIGTPATASAAAAEGGRA